jgi:hypothetical protein
VSQRFLSAAAFSIDHFAILRPKGFRLMIQSLQQVIPIFGIVIPAKTHFCFTMFDSFALRSMLGQR